jgi:hypothetical protein
MNCQRVSVASLICGGPECDLGSLAPFCGFPKADVRRRLTTEQSDRSTTRQASLRWTLVFVCLDPRLRPIALRTAEAKNLYFIGGLHRAHPKDNCPGLVAPEPFPAEGVATSARKERRSDLGPETPGSSRRHFEPHSHCTRIHRIGCFWISPHEAQSQSQTG